MWQEVEPPRDTIGYHGCIYIWNPKGIKMILKDTQIPIPVGNDLLGSSIELQIVIVDIIR